MVDLSRRGYFEMEEREGRSRRRISIEPGDGGQLERRWFVDDDERTYDQEASNWLGEMIPLLFRRVGLQAEERAGRILDRLGPDGVLQEISQIPSDYIARRYYQVLLTDGDLDATQLRSIVRQAGNELESDYELAELLIAILHRHPVDEALTREFFDAVHTLDSDYEHNRVLKVALHEGAPNLAVLDLSLESATHIDSDYERAELLLEVARLYPVEQDIPPSYLVAAQSLGSDYELCRVLKSLIAHQQLSEGALDAVMDAALTLDSDYELANLLIAVAEEHTIDGELRTRFLDVADAISSDHERGRVLAVLTPRRGRAT